MMIGADQMDLDGFGNSNRSNYGQLAPYNDLPMSMTRIDLSAVYPVIFVESLYVFEAEIAAPCYLLL